MLTNSQAYMRLLLEKTSLMKVFNILVVTKEDHFSFSLLQSRCIFYFLGL